MPCNNRKEWDKVVAAVRVRVFPDFQRRTLLCVRDTDNRHWRKHSRFYSVYLWDTLEDLRRNSVNTSADDTLVDGHAYACYLEDCFLRKPSKNRCWQWILEHVVDAAARKLGVPWTRVGYTRRVHPKLGEIHFASGAWTVDLVAHEVFHAVSHIMNYIGPAGDECVQRAQGPRFSTGNAQEDVAYVMGHMTRNIFDWLWEVDPSGRPRLNEWELP